MTIDYGMHLGAPQWDVHDRMRKALRVAGLGVSEIAEYLGISRGSASNYLNGRIQPKTQTLRLWALRCGVGYEWLRDGSEGSGPDGPLILTNGPLAQLAEQRTFNPKFAHLAVA